MIGTRLRHPKNLPSALRTRIGLTHFSGTSLIGPELASSDDVRQKQHFCQYPFGILRVVVMYENLSEHPENAFPPASLRTLIVSFNTTKMIIRNSLNQNAIFIIRHGNRINPGVVLGQEHRKKSTRNTVEKGLRMFHIMPRMRVECRS